LQSLGLFILPKKIVLMFYILQMQGLNVYSILQHDTLVMTRDAINRIVERIHTPISR
jgi:ribosomal protein L4